MSTLTLFQKFFLYNITSISITLQRLTQ